MKKYLILLLVLVLASSASAVTISLTSGGKSTLYKDTDWTVGTVITVDLKSDALCAGISSIDFLNTGQNIAAVGAWYDAGAATNSFDPGFSNNGTLTPGGGGLDADVLRAFGNAYVGKEVAIGQTLYSFSVTVKGNGTISLDMPNSSDFYYAFAGNTAGANVIKNSLSIVPEPMTIALLGLGGLFLRRRK